MNQNLVKRIFWCLIGVAVIGVGCAVFKVSNLGNDAFTALNITISERTGISLGTVTLLVNCVYFLAPLFFGRKYINIGTILNGGLLGYLVDFFYKTIIGIFGKPASFTNQLIWLIPGIIIISLGLSLYQNADLGVGPYDYLALGMRDHLKLPYFGCRIFTDGMCALAAWLLGGLVGLGTLVCAFCLGPFVSFFDRNVSGKLMPHE
ncbi:MAG: YitT family protein [Solobacterium sp.]|nr:YitT family protein [Solobacterium sp.]